MTWGLKSFVQNITDILKANAPPRVAMGQDPTADPAAFNPQVIDSSGRSYTVPSVAVAGGTPAAVTGVVGTVPEPKTYEYDTGLEMTFTPFVSGLSVGLSDTGAESVTLAGDFITVTFNGGVSTVASLTATWAASDAADVCGFSGDAGTIPLAAAYGPEKLFEDRTVLAAATLLKDITSDEYLALQGDKDGNAIVRDALVPIGAATTPADPSCKVGVTGRLPRDVTFTIDAGMTATVHPLVGGVSIIFATAAAAAVSATGKVVTLTAKNAPALTDITAMNVLIAASASVSALIGPLVGTGADTFDAALAIAETPLWTTGTIPANAMIVLGNDGYWWPAERDSTGGIKVSQSSLIAGEDITSGRLKVMPKTTNGSGGAAIAVSSTAHNAPCVVHRLMVSETGGANPVTVYLRDGGAGGTVRTPIYTVAASGAISLELNLTFGTDCYMTIGGAGTATAGVTVHTG